MARPALPQLPPLTPIQRRFDAPRIDDVPAALARALEACNGCVRQDQRIALAVGSRGIANLPQLVAGLVEWIHRQGGQAFLVPAMGSHGGATDAGQRDVLLGYGLDEQTVGAPIESSMQTVELPRAQSPVPVYFDRNAYQADATILINRIKPHTSFHGPHESGLMKMLAIGLGKQDQARAIHDRGVRGLRDDMPAVARDVLAGANVLLGLAVVENALDQTMHIEAVRADRIPQRDAALLDMARANMPSLPADKLDLLIVDEMGKDISGLGMDPNIIGRLRIRGQAEPESPDISLIYVRGLTPRTHGNAIGIGLADITRRQVLDRIDFAATYANLATTTFLQRGMLPLLADDDAHAMSLVLDGLGRPDPARLRICRIRNTLQLDRVSVSPALLEDFQGRDDIQPLGPAAALLNDKGQMP